MTSSALAEAIAKALADAGVDHLFGMPGGGNNLDVIGACEAVGIRFVLAHTETGAAIMASAWAEVRGSVGACVVTRGPGAASAVNGAAQADQDRQPLLLLCDTVDAASSPRIAHQNIDQRALFAPVTRWSTTLGTAEPDEVMRNAIAVATTPPRGAVHLDVDPGVTSRDPAPPGSSHEGSLADVARFLSDAERPLIIVGVGGRPYAKAVRDLVAGTGIPVMMTYKARGVVPDSEPNSAGNVTGARTDGLLLNRADLIVTIGLDSIELIPNTWPYPAPVVALTEARDPFRYLEPAATVVGPLSELLAGLPPLRDRWPAGAAADHRARIERGLFDGPALRPGIAPAAVVRAVRAAAPPGSVATVDAGAHMLVAMPLWTVDEPGEVLISSGLATMGYSLPAAIGAALAGPGVRVYCFVGDGGLQMCLGELETLARLALDVTVVVFNDRTLSLIKAKQRPTGHGGAGAVQYAPTDFAAVARGMGVPGRGVENEAQLSAALADQVDGPDLLDVRVHADAYRHVIDVVRNAAGR
jgi:acetolactate synthase I/II/III large subunit